MTIVPMSVHPLSCFPFSGFPMTVHRECISGVFQINYKCTNYL